LPTQHTAIQQRAEDSRPAAAERGSRRAKKAPTRRQRARRRTVLVMLIILLLGLLTGYGAWYLAVGRYHQVPAVSGQAQSAATQLLRRDGFAVNPVLDQAYSETVPVGAVLGTHPDAGAHLLDGKLVQLVVSKGPERYSVPAVVGLTYNQAQQAFSGMPVQLKRTDAADSSGQVPAGSVMRTDPDAATKVKRDAIVTVYVSTGPPIVTVPGVTGQAQGDATSTLSQAMFKVSTSEAYSDKVPAGSVVSQDPGPKGSAAKFSTVKLVISKGPEFVTIPDFPNGSDPDVARATLQNLGLTVKVVNHKSFLDFTAAKVDKTDPGAGTSVRVGSIVVLIVK
ncbi:MAG: PASTA domain-containing protein, partial [Actinomycetota bacterium]|nr:PASTA domain-containing protein [Actinomycetota bacterium]